MHLEHSTNQPARQENIKAIVDYYKSGIKNSCTKIGIELEHTLVHKNGDAVSYDDTYGQRVILEQLSCDYEQKTFTSDGNLIGLSNPAEAITLEPGSQVEISAGPFEDLAVAKDCFDSFESRLSDVVSPQGIDVLAIGYHPTRRAIDLPLLPKKRYEFMNEYLGAISMFGICMMRGSASTQVSIDYTSVEDCIRKMRLAFACVPTLSLMTDNSPIFESAPRPHYLMRTEIWEKCDPARCMLVPGIMDDTFTLEHYANYILDTPAIVAINNGKECLSSKTFGELFAQTPMTQDNVEHALSMFFTDIRLKKYIEIRPADAMPVNFAIAYASLIKGLFYCENSLQALEELFEGVNATHINDAKASLMRNNYNGQVYGRAASLIADKLIAIAQSGLSSKEQQILQPLANLVARRETLADIATF